MSGTLCPNRPEGFGPQSNLYAHQLTSCFLDIIFVPGITWLFVLSLLLIIYTTRRRIATKYTSAPQPSRNHRILHIIYYLLIIAAAGMATLEIVRLALASLGIGLLPFTYAGLAVAALLRGTRGVRGRVLWWRWANVFLWVGLMVGNALKLAGEVKEGVDTRKDTKYPMSDQITDVAIMLALYVVLAVLEIVLV
ncbi:MAG: hypothetical protein M1829_004724 [Trizodia sp. TS-e1964]|nr:MAG: hypothetical protein M1829_004724 [Trizodia sp. TS-e1964]